MWPKKQRSLRETPTYHPKHTLGISKPLKIGRNSFMNCWLGVWDMLDTFFFNGGFGCCFFVGGRTFCSGLTEFSGTFCNKVGPYVVLNGVMGPRKWPKINSNKLVVGGLTLLLGIITPFITIIGAHLVIYPKYYQICYLNFRCPLFCSHRVDSVNLWESEGIRDLWIFGTFEQCSSFKVPEEKLLELPHHPQRAIQKEENAGKLILLRI